MTLNNQNKETVTKVPKTPTPKQQTQPNPLLQIATAMQQLNNRLNLVEIESKKILANMEILSKTMDLIDKKIEFVETRLKNNKE